MVDQLGERKRRDATRNYATLLAAAEEVFSESGPECPLQLVIDRAGVGRGTLYRHFPDRESLVAAIYEARLERYEAYCHEHHDDPLLLLHVLQIVAHDQMAIPGLFRLIAAGAGVQQELDRLWARTIRVFEEPLRVSLASGTVRATFTVPDVLLLIGMLYGVANSPPAAQHGEAAMTRALRLVELAMTP